MRINIRFSEIELNGQTTMSQLGYAKEMLKVQYQSAIDQISIFEAALNMKALCKLSEEEKEKESKSPFRTPKIPHKEALKKQGLTQLPTPPGISPFLPK